MSPDVSRPPSIRDAKPRLLGTSTRCSPRASSRSTNLRARWFCWGRLALGQAPSSAANSRAVTTDVRACHGLGHRLASSASILTPPVHRGNSGGKGRLRVRAKRPRLVRTARLRHPAGALMTSNTQLRTRMSHARLSPRCPRRWTCGHDVQPAGERLVAAARLGDYALLCLPSTSSRDQPPRVSNRGSRRFSGSGTRSFCRNGSKVVLGAGDAK